MKKKNKNKNENENKNNKQISFFSIMSKKKKTQQHEQRKKKHKKGDNLHAAPTSFQFLLDTDEWLPAVNSPEVAVIHEILILVTHFVQGCLVF